MDEVLEKECVQLNCLPLKLADFKKLVDNILINPAPEYASVVVLASKVVLQEVYDVALMNPEIVRLNRRGIAEFCGYSQFVLSALHVRHPLSKIEQYCAAQIASQSELASELLVNGISAYEKKNQAVTNIMGRVIGVPPSERKG